MAITNGPVLWEGKHGRDVLKVTQDDVSGKPMIGIRLWYYDESETLRPGNKGLFIKPEVWAEVLSALALPKANGRKAGVK